MCSSGQAAKEGAERGAVIVGYGALTKRSSSLGLIWRENVIRVNKILKAGDVLTAELLTQPCHARTEGAQTLVHVKELRSSLCGRS